MPEIIQNWLGTKLGILIDMSPEKFARHTKSGKLLAQLLLNYGVIPTHVFENVKETKNYYECYNNLTLLQPWLKRIGVIHDDDTLRCIAGGEGSTAVSLFYSVYLALERKDRLHFISGQKERRICQNYQKFKITSVPEKFVSGNRDGVDDSELKEAKPLYDNPDMIAWHKAKCKEIVERIKKTKAKYRKIAKKQALGPLTSKHASSKPLAKTEAEQTREEIAAFEKTHPCESPDLNYEELTQMQNFNEAQPYFIPSMSEGKNIINNIKCRKKGELFSQNFQIKMQHLLLGEEWKKILANQEKLFENKVCENLLKQSQYEKQMTMKLYLLRNQKRVLTENRRKIECLKIDQRQRDYDETVLRNLEVMGEYKEDEEIERERLKEVHRKLYDERVRIRRIIVDGEARKIYEALVNIAIRIAEFREYIGYQVPKHLMKDLKELFYKDLPIFDILDHLEEVHLNPPMVPCELPGEEDFTQQETDLYSSDELLRLRSAETDRQSILDECDFNDYLNLMGPWMVELLLPSGTETEGKQLVLGYIVHKLLASKYPYPNVPTPVNMKPMKPASIIHGLYDETAVNMLVDLMNACRILVVKVEDAINFVLSAYKNELSVVRDIDVNFQIMTDQTLHKSSFTAKQAELSKKVQLLKTECSQVLDAEEGMFIDKNVQTPRMIPEDDPLLSSNAELGKQAFEALGVGDPVPDPTIASAIVSYILSKQEKYNGFVILNYPLLYSQASDMEYILLGCRTLPFLDTNEKLDEVEAFFPRSTYGSSPFKDTFRDSRFSKLVPLPEVFSPSERDVPKTYFDSVIKMKKTSGNSKHDFSDLVELNQMEKFYWDLEILFNFEYQNLNFQTMKNLGRQILGVGTTESEISRKNSSEVFGRDIYELNEKWEGKVSTKDAKGGLKKVPYEISESEVEGGQDELVEEVLEESPEGPKPGDPTWEWATGPVPCDLLNVLAELWENMEAVYIQDFRNLFFCLRVHRSNACNYCSYIRKSFRILMRRPDEKQKVLCDFQHMFNEIDEDLRPDLDIKCELHVRVSELEQGLMSISDERKKNLLMDASNIAKDGWVSDEMMNLVNIFSSALQLEADRCVDSCQVIMDYYGCITQKTPDPKPIAKVVVPKLQVNDRKYEVSSSASFRSPITSDLKKRFDSSKLSGEKYLKTRSFADKKRSNDSSVLLGAAEFIINILTNLTLPEDGLTPFHTFFIENVESITEEVKSIVENCILEAKKSEKMSKTVMSASKNLKKSETNVTSSNDNVTLEWVTALQDELTRFTFRSQLILARGMFDMNELLMMILNILSSLTEEINEMYLKEIQSISECCKVFRCGIEEEIRIRPVLELKLEEFLIHAMEEEESNSEDASSSRMSEDRKRLTFKFQQLHSIFSKLQRVSPKGEIIKRSLVYILEDLRVMNTEIENCFPDIWQDIEPNDMTTIMNEVFQDLEIVHWKDFIIYAMELPLPTEAEILAMRQDFRNFDPLATELVTRENYDRATLWFEKYTNDTETEKSTEAKNLLYSMYQVNAVQMNYTALLLAFCKDTNPEVGFSKALALSLGKPVKKHDETPTESIPGEAQSYHYNVADYSVTDTYRKRPCCPSVSTEVTLKCIPKEKITRCECKTEEVENSTEDTLDDDSVLNYVDELDAGEGIFGFGLKLDKSSSSVSFIPLNILSNLIKASFPALPQLTILLDCPQTMQDTLCAIYDSLEAYDSAVQLHKLLRHDFIRRLLHSTNKFKHVDLKMILLSIAKPKPPLSRALCVKDKQKVSFCLRN